MLYRLIVLTGPLKNQRITVDAEPMTLGRASDCEISIPDDEVAQKHAVIEHKPDGGMQIRDLGTMNKLLVNGRELRESRLKHGDMVEIGRTRFLVQAVVQAEVSGQGGAVDVEEGANPRVIVAALVVLALLVLTAVRWNNRRHAPLPQETAVVSNAPAPLVVVPVEATSAPPAVTIVTARETVVVSAPPENPSPQVTEELRKLRDDLASMKERVLAQTSAVAPPPPIVVAPAPPIAIPVEPAVTTVAPVVAVATAAPPEVAAPKPSGRVLRVLNVTHSRLPPSDDLADLRAFTVVLSQIDPSFPIDNEQVHVSLTFYDEDEQTGAIRPSDRVQAMTDLRPSQPWGTDRRGTVTATYALPKTPAAGPSSGQTHYYGLVARVDYAGREQDVWAQPKNLLADAAQPGGQAVADGSHAAPQR